MACAHQTSRPDWSEAQRARKKTRVNHCPPTKQVRAEKDAEFEPLLDACEAANLLRIRVGKFWRYRASDLEKELRSGSRFSGQPADRMDFTKEKT